jgi:SpoVK/Ycf46/Vps4 family AAA+-type ATPase
MRKGADCLCKYVGESERQLRLLFEQAYQQRPSIIFFDEIDGLAPVRSARQDQIHASIVSTLLALMDGLDNRGEVVVIGATNRLDAIDPALRRPGRFDREFRFSLPTLEARKQILKIHTKDWESKPHSAFIDEMAIRTASFCGADLKSLCQEAFLSALRRRYPQIYESRQKYKIDPRSLHLSRGDFYSALHRIVPACNRGCQHPIGRPLDMHLIPLLSEQLDKCLNQLNEIFFKRIITNKNSTHLPFQSISDDLTTSAVIPKTPTVGLTTSFASSSHRSATFTMKSQPDNGLCRFFAPAVVQQLDCAFFVFELGYLHGQASRTPEEACAQLFTEARRSAPSIIYIPDIENLWPKLSESVQYMFVSNVRTLPPNLPILILIALETDSFDDIHPDVKFDLFFVFFIFLNFIYLDKSDYFSKIYFYINNTKFSRSLCFFCTII